jgi:hypothetical protein
MKITRYSDISKEFTTARNITYKHYSMKAMIEHLNDLRFKAQITGKTYISGKFNEIYKQVIES